MGKVIILNRTYKDPITMMGEMSGVCYGADVSDPTKNYKRGLENLQSQHGRTLEFPQIYFVLDGYSARVIREFYTHIAGGPTRLQSSTRYIDYGDFDYIIPDSIKNDQEAVNEYVDVMESIKEGFIYLQEHGVPKEDIANILPLGMTTKVVCRTNPRHMIDMSHQRECNRAYWEFRQLMSDFKTALAEYSEEWKYIVDTEFMPKCKYLGHCPETHPCFKSTNS